MRRRDSAVSPHDVAIGVAVVVGNEVAVAEEVHEAVPNPIHLQQQQQEQHPKAAAKHWTHEKSEWDTTAWSRPVSVSSTRPVSASVARPLSVKSHDSVSVSRSSSVLSGGGLWSLEVFFDVIGGGGSGNHNRRRSSLLGQSCKTDLTDAEAVDLTNTLAYHNPRYRRNDKAVEITMQEFEDTGDTVYRTQSLRQLADNIALITGQWDVAGQAKTTDRLNRSNVSVGSSIKSHSGVGAIRIRIRDLRILDYNINPSDVFSVVVRRHAVLISLDPIRAIVMANKVVLMVPSGSTDAPLSLLGDAMKSWSKEYSDRVQRAYERDLPVGSSRDRTGGGGGGGDDDEGDDDCEEDGDNRLVSFEMHMYDAIFTTLNTLHAQQYKAFAEQGEVVLSYFSHKMAILIPIEVLVKFRTLKNDVDVFATRLRAYRRALSTLTADDEAMALMNLSILREAPWYYNAPLQPEMRSSSHEVEELLQSYLIEANTLQAKLDHLSRRLEHAEEDLTYQLGMSQNRILGESMFLFAVHLCNGIGTTCTGAVTMNLDNITTLMNSPTPGMFAMVSVLTGALLVLGPFFLSRMWKASGIVPVFLEYRPPTTGGGAETTIEENVHRALRSISGLKLLSGLTDDQKSTVTVQEFDDAGSAAMQDTTMRQLWDGIRRTYRQWDSERGAQAASLRGAKAAGVGAIRIRVRDLRILDYDVTPTSGYTVIVRRHAVLISLHPIRAVVMANKVFLVLPAGGLDNILSILGGHMASWSAQQQQGPKKAEVERVMAQRDPLLKRANSGGSDGDDDDDFGDSDAVESLTCFEMHAYDAIFTTLNTMHAHYFKSLEEQAAMVLSYFNQRTAIVVPAKVQELFRTLKNDVDVFVNQVKSYRRALTTLLEDDEAMALMNLSILKEAPGYYTAPLRPEILACREGVEELIESYSTEINTLLVRLDNLCSRLEHAEENVRRHLTMAQNRLLAWDVRISTWDVCIKFSNYATGILGMNLDAWITIYPRSGGWFAIVDVVTGTFIPVASSCLVWFWKRRGIIPTELKYRRK